MPTRGPTAGPVKRGRLEKTGIIPGLGITETEPAAPPTVTVPAPAGPAATCRAPIRFYRQKREGFLDPRTARLVRSCARVRGYCIRALSRGADWILWNKHAFVKKSGLRMHYVEEVMRTLRKTSTEFEITEFRYKRSPRLKIAWRGRGRPLTETEIRRRLIGYIRGALRHNAGRPVKVDLFFLNHFIATTQLPREVVLAVADGMKFIAGCDLRWRGVGENFKFIVSLQDSSPPYGSPTERRYRNTVAPSAPGVPNQQSNAVPAISRSKGPPISCPPTATASPFPSPPALRVSDGNPSGAPSRPCLAKPMPRPDALTKQLGRVGTQGTLADPIQIGDRWISGQKIMRFACWLALEPMRAAHLRADQVQWRFAHARNFAARALRAGHRAARVLQAYADGVQASHEDALDARESGKIALLAKGDGSARECPRGVTPREPSAAVVYAWRILLQDRRSPAERWCEILAAPRTPRIERAQLSAADRARTGAPKAALRAAGDRQRFQELKSVHDIFTAVHPGNGAASRGEDAPITAAELIAHLKSRDMTLAQFKNLSWSAQKRTLQVVMAKRPAKDGHTK